MTRCPDCYARIKSGELALIVHRVEQCTNPYGSHKKPKSRAAARKEKEAKDKPPAEPTDPALKGLKHVTRRPSGPAPKLVHGTRNMYQRHACRCDECKAAQMAYNNRWRQKRRAAGLEWHYDKKQAG